MNKEQIKEEFLKSYNCASLEQFKKKMLTSDKFYEIIDDYLTKCTYNQKFQDEQKEFIEWLEHYKKALLNVGSKKTIDCVLEKYKEIVGYKE